MHPDTCTCTCNLCGERDAKPRPGRLGRYAVTCDRCESRRGTHLASATGGRRGAPATAAAAPAPSR